MKICIATHINRIGGVHTFLNNLINNWPNKKDVFNLILNKDFPEKKKFLNSLKNKKDQIFFNFLLPDSIFLKIIITMINLIYLFFKFLIIFHVNNYDRLIIVSGGYPLSLPNKIIFLAWITVKSSKKLIINIHNLNSDSSWKNLIFDYLIDKIITTLKVKLVLVSRSCINSIKKNRILFKKYKNYKVVYNGIKSVNYDFYKMKKNKFPICLMLSTYEKRKGHEFILKVFKKVLQRVKNAKLLIYGHNLGNEKKNLAKLVNFLGLKKNVYLNDFCHNNYALIRKSNLIVVPSRELESFGLTIIEGMSQKKPIVASDVGGIKEVIKNSQAGFLVKKNNLNLFAKQVIKILADIKLQKKLGENGYNYFKKNFTVNLMINEYLKILNNLN